MRTYFSSVGGGYVLSCMQLKNVMLPILGRRICFELYAIEKCHAAHTCLFWGIFTFAKVEC